MGPNTQSLKGYEWKKEGLKVGLIVSNFEKWCKEKISEKKKEKRRRV
jgi:hypothetical protein